MSQIAAGSFSASVSQETGSLYLWGTGSFGEFHSPHRVKRIPERVEHVSIGDKFGVALTIDHQIYSWGENAQGQLGTGDFESLSTPRQMQRLTSDGRVVQQVACGSSFVLCLGQVEAAAE